MTPHMTIDNAVDRLRVNPKVDVAVAVSSWETKAWMAIRGASKRRPWPMPAMIWNPVVRAMEECAEKRM